MTKLNRVLGYALILALLISASGIVSVSAAPPLDGSQNVRTISLSGSVTPQAGATGADVAGVQSPEFATGLYDKGAAALPALGANSPSGQKIEINRSKSLRNDDSHEDKNRPLSIPRVRPSRLAGANPDLITTFAGLNHRNQRLANHGNQFSLEPPDQGLCVGNGGVVETVNDVFRVFDTAGNPLTGVIDLNSFYGYPAQFNRTTRAEGPFVTDPSCIFDSATQRWFVLVLTLDVNPTTGAFLGSNHLDLAVSKTANPTGAYNIYRIAVQDDGTQGTPNHGCSLGPCIGDFPHIGADKNAIILTTNEYSLFGPEFHAAQVYAISKSALAAGAASITVVQFDTVGAVAGKAGFTLWPANVPDTNFANGAHGTEYFLSSTAADEVNCPTFTCNLPGISNNIVLWALTNTSSLNTLTPALNLRHDVIKSETYAIPPLSEQKPGDFPLGQCINNTTLVTPFGAGCWQIFFNPPGPAHDEVESHLDSSDTRFLTVWLANQKLYGALGTAVKVNGKTKAGIAFFIVQPEVDDGKLKGEIEKQGYVAVENNNVTYPAIATLADGKGVMAFNMVGETNYPSAAYASINDDGVGDIHVASAGKGPSDGFTSYKAFVGDPPRTRWGDYGAAVTDGRTIWIASESIEQTCTFAQYTAGVSATSLGSFGSCGATRTSLANWATRISNVTP